MSQRKSRSFTLLEVMVVLVLLAIGAGAVWWRIDRLLERQRFDSDAARLENLLHCAQALAINTHADWQLGFEVTKEGCKARLFCVEDPDRSSFAREVPPLKNCQLSFDGKPMAALVLDFFSTGQVSPKGVLKVESKGSKREFGIPGLFHQEES